MPIAKSAAKLMGQGRATDTEDIRSLSTQRNKKMSGKYETHGWKTHRVNIQGMHCANCETLIERKFKKISGVRRVDANHVTGTVEISHYGNLDIKALQAALGDEEYTVEALSQQSDTPPRSKNSRRDYF